MIMERGDIIVNLTVAKQWKMLYKDEGWAWKGQLRYTWKRYYNLVYNSSNNFARARLV